MKKLKIAVVGMSKYYFNPFSPVADHVESFDDADILLFTGGSDISPDLYGHPKYFKTFSDISRDLYERRIFKQYNGKKAFIGICRGSQLLTVLNHGKLIQDCDNHGIFGTHRIETKDGKAYDITSTHHQMMYPFNLDKSEYDLIAWSSPARSTHYWFKDKELTDIEKEPEIVLYPKTRSLAIQGHPEMMVDHSGRESVSGKIPPVVEFINNLIKKL